MPTEAACIMSLTQDLLLKSKGSFWDHTTLTPAWLFVFIILTLCHIAFSKTVKLSNSICGTKMQGCTEELTQFSAERTGTLEFKIFLSFTSLLTVKSFSNPEMLFSVLSDSNGHTQSSLRLEAQQHLLTDLQLQLESTDQTWKSWVCMKAHLL